MSLGCIAEACAFLGDTGAAAELYDLLRPFAGRNAVLGMTTAYFGCVSRPRARRAGA